MSGEEGRRDRGQSRVDEGGRAGGRWRGRTKEVGGAGGGWRSWGRVEKLVEGGGTEESLLKEPSMRVMGPGSVYFTGTGLVFWARRYSR